MRQTIIGAADANRRLDKYLAGYMNTAGKNFIYKMLRKKRIKLNGNKATGSEMLAETDVITFYLSDETIGTFMEAKSLTAATSEIEAVYEDKNILIVNKPTGLLTHSDEKGDSLIDRALLYLYNKDEFNPSESSTFTPAACNRLDRNTSGIVVIGKTLAAVQALNAIIHDRHMEKYYLAIVKGRMAGEAVLEGYLEKDADKNTVEIKQKEKGEREGNGQKQVVTHYEVVRTNGRYTLLRVNLVTGRSHQIRAHMKLIGHPIIGDPKYGDTFENNALVRSAGVRCQLLHAAEIRFKANNNLFEHLSGRSFCCEPPAGFKSAARQLGL